MTQPTLANLFTDYSPQTSGTNNISSASVDSTGKILTITYAENLTPLEQVSAILLAAQGWLYQNTDTTVNANASQLSQTGPTTRNGTNKMQVSVAFQLYPPAIAPSIDVTTL